MNVLDDLYAKLPVWAQHCAVSSYGVYWHALRFGPGFQRYVSSFAARDRFTADEWTAWQAERLKHTLGAAATSVPYYRDRFSSKQKRAALAGHLQELPLLEKDALRENPYQFVREDRRRPRLAFPTSGSTGTPVISLWTPGELRQSLAVREVRSAGWAGVSFREPRATFSGRLVEPDPQSRGPFHRFNAVERQVYLSPFHLRPDTAARYVEALRRHDVRWLTGYAVSSYVLARFILEQGLEPLALHAVITTSEKLTTQMREVIECAYGCRAWQEYSTVENVLFASECEMGALHISPDIAFVEIVRPDGTRCAPGEIGEVVATPLMDRRQMMVRFRLGDLAAWATEPCSCGRGMPVLREVVGRVEDIVVSPDGRQLVRFHGIFLGGPRVTQGQVIQEALDRIRVKVVPDSGYDATDEAKIAQRVQQRVGSMVRVVVEPVACIPASASGKIPAVVSLLSHETRAQLAVRN